MGRTSKSISAGYSASAYFTCTSPSPSPSSIGLEALDLTADHNASFSSGPPSDGAPGSVDVGVGGTAGGAPYISKGDILSLHWALSTAELSALAANPKAVTYDIAL